MKPPAEKKKRDLAKERESEMAAIWGSERRGTDRVPRRKNQKTSLPLRLDEMDMKPQNVDDANLSDVASEISNVSDGQDESKRSARKQKQKKVKSAKAAAKYRLHCFVEGGTTVNDVRQVFEQYEPAVEIRTSQRGNVLNKVHYAVLTFKNKAMALHAVQQLDGTNQRDLLGVTELKLAMMLSREQNKIARKKSRKELVKSLRERKQRAQSDEAQFLKRFMESHGVA